MKDKSLKYYFITFSLKVVSSLNGFKYKCIQEAVKKKLCIFLCLTKIVESSRTKWIIFSKTLI